MSIFYKKLIVFALATSAGLAAQQAASGGASTLATVRITKALMADGKSLAAGSYQVRLTGEDPAPAVGQSPHAERWVEFVSGGAVKGREVATVVTADRMKTMAKGPQPTPKAESYRVDTLRGGEYVRVWINHAGTHYLINLRNPGK